MNGIQPIRTHTWHKSATHVKHQEGQIIYITLSQFQGPATFVHLVLLDLTSAQMVHTSSGVPFHDEAVGRSGPLFAFEDVEVVVRRVTTRMTFGTERRAEND
jgi:hypothetical protein